MFREHDKLWDLTVDAEHTYKLHATTSFGVATEASRLALDSGAAAHHSREGCRSR